MGGEQSRTVEIQISNNTRNITLENPRIHFYSGHSLVPPEAVLIPGCSNTCKFTNNTSFWGCHGVLAFEAESFTLALYFRNPISYSKHPAALGLELSLDKIHLGDLEDVYERMSRRSHDDSGRDPAFHHVDVNYSQQCAQVSAGPVKVMATMSNARSARIKVVLEEVMALGKEAGRRIQEKGEPAGPLEGPRGQP